MFSWSQPRCDKNDLISSIALISQKYIPNTPSCSNLLLLLRQLLGLPKRSGSLNNGETRVLSQTIAKMYDIDPNQDLKSIINSALIAAKVQCDSESLIKIMLWTGNNPESESCSELRQQIRSVIGMTNTQDLKVPLSENELRMAIFRATGKQNSNLKHGDLLRYIRSMPYPSDNESQPMSTQTETTQVLTQKSPVQPESMNRGVSFGTQQNINQSKESISRIISNTQDEKTKKELELITDKLTNCSSALRDLQKSKDQALFEVDRLKSENREMKNVRRKLNERTLQIQNLNEDMSKQQSSQNFNDKEVEGLKNVVSDLRRMLEKKNQIVTDYETKFSKVEEFFTEMSKENDEKLNSARQLLNSYGIRHDI
jgi:hypothetical protein